MNPTMNPTINRAESEERKVSFDSAATYYDRYRPTYSEEIFEFIEKVIHSENKLEIFEFGCGSGQSTLEFLKRGHSVCAIDISKNLISLLKEKAHQHQSLKLQNIPFEEFDSGEKLFDLVFASQAKHWIDKGTLYKKSHDLLKPDGQICWVRNNMIFPDPELRLKLDQIYLEHFPLKSKENGGTYNAGESYKQKVETEINESNLFTEVVTKLYKFEKQYTSDEYVGLMKSQSDHIVAAKHLDKFYLELESLITSYNNSIRVQYDSYVTLAKKIE